MEPTENAVFLHSTGDAESLPFTTVDRENSPDGHELVLYRQGRDFFIYIDGQELMSSRTHGSERALALLGCRHLTAAKSPRILVGGLGLGYTSAAALEVLPATAEVDVAELFPTVVRWHREHLASLAMPLDDPRLRIHVRDVADLIEDASRGRRYQAILLDVDNGPSALCVDENQGLYGREGIAAIRAALTPDGVLAVWSTDPDRGFVRRLGSAGFEASAEPVRAHGGKGARHTIFVARKRRHGQR